MAAGVNLGEMGRSQYDEARDLRRYELTAPDGVRAVPLKTSDVSEVDYFSVNRMFG